MSDQFSLEGDALEILVVASCLPDETWGAGIRTLYLLRLLARQHAITWFAQVSPEDNDERRYAPLRPLTRDIRVVTYPPATSKRLRQVGSLLRGRHPKRDAMMFAEAQLALDELFAERPFDFVIFDDLFIAAYRIPPSIPTMIDEHNIEHELVWRSFRGASSNLRRAYRFLEYWPLRRYELERVRRASATIVCSERERSQLKRLVPGGNIHVVPNGVDVERYPAPTRGAGVAARLILTGTMRYPPNAEGAIWFVRECWRRIREAQPDATLTIVGANPPAEVSRLASEPGVTVTGYVPDVRPYLEEATIAVAPLWVGGGTRLKVLEALASGLPTVSTSLGCEGIDVIAGAHLLVADTAEAFIAAVLDLARDPALRAALGQAGRDLAAQRYSWEASGAALREAIDTACVAGAPL